MENKTIVIDGVSYNCIPIDKEVDNGFEVLTLRDKNTHSLASYDKGEVGIYSYPLKHPYLTRESFVKSFLQYDQWEIYSVKRSSDGEIFTVGDKITGTMSWQENPARLGYTTIKGFYLEEDQLCIEIYTGVVKNYKQTGLAINTIQKYVEKPVLFTTEDGVGIRVGDKSYGFDTINNQYSGIYTWEKLEYFNIKTSLFPDVKYFSTEEKAREYANLHEKKYSKQEILDVLKAVEDEYIVHGGVYEIRKRLNL